MVWSRIVRPALAPVLPRKEAVPRLEAGAGCAQRGGVVGHAGEREIADRDHVRAGVVRPRMAAAVAERVELLDIADGERGLRRHPGAQADLEGAVRQRIERAERQAGAGAALRIGGDQDARLLRLDRDDRRGQSDLDRRQMRFDHLSARAVIVTTDVIVCEAAIQSRHWQRRLRSQSIIPDRAGKVRPPAPAVRGPSPRPRSSCGPCGRACDRRADQHRVGRGGRRRFRGSPARLTPRRAAGLSAQAAMKAPAVERLMPA